MSPPGRPELRLPENKKFLTGLGGAPEGGGSAVWSLPGPVRDGADPGPAEQRSRDSELRGRTCGGSGPEQSGTKLNRFSPLHCETIFKCSKTPRILYKSRFSGFLKFHFSLFIFHFVKFHVCLFDQKLESSSFFLFFFFISHIYLNLNSLSLLFRYLKKTKQKTTPPLIMKPATPHSCGFNSLSAAIKSLLSSLNKMSGCYK